METLKTFSPLKDGTIGYCTDINMAEQSIGIDGREDQICQLKINSSSKITSDVTTFLSHSSEKTDCLMEDVQTSVGGIHKEHEGTNSVQNIFHGETCDSNEHEKIIGATKINGIIDCVSVPYIHKIDTPQQPDFQSQCLDSSSLSSISNNQATDQSPNSLNIKQTTSSSSIVSHDKTDEPDLAKADRDTRTLSAVKSPAIESFKEDETISGTKSMNAESLEEDEIISGTKSMNAESLEEDGIISGTKSMNAESLEEDGIISGSKSTNAELLEDDGIISGTKSMNAESLEKDGIISGTKFMDAESLEDHGIISGTKSMITESLEDDGTISGTKSMNAESLKDEIISGTKSMNAESLEDDGIVSGTKSMNAESLEDDGIISGTKSMNAESLEDDGIISGTKSMNAESLEEDDIISGTKSMNAESLEEDDIISGTKSTNVKSLEEDDIISGTKSTNADSLEEDGIFSGIKSTNAELLEDNGIISGIKSISAELFEEKQSADDVSNTSLDRSRNTAIICSPEMASVESAAEHIYDNSSQADCVQEHERNAANLRTASDNEDVEDMQVEGHELMAKIGDCFTISETEMDCTVTESEAAAEADEAANLTDMDEMPVSVKKAEPVSPSDSCNVLLSQCEKLDEVQGHSLSEQDTISVDGSAPVDDVCQDMASHRTDEDTCDIRITDSRSVGGDFTEYAASNEIICLEESDTEQEIVSKENNVFCKESESGPDPTLIGNNCLEQAKQQNSSHNSEEEMSDQCTVENTSENLDEVTSEMELKSKKTPDLSCDQSNHDLDVKVNILSTENEKCVIGQSCELTNLHSYNCTPDKTTKTHADDNEPDSCTTQSSDKSTEDKTSMVQYKVSEINKTCTTLCETDKVNDKLSFTEHSKIVGADYSKDDASECSGSSKDAKSDIKIANIVDKKETVDNKLEIKDLGAKHKVVNLGKVIEESLKEEQQFNSKIEIDTAENIEEDDILFVDEAGESKPVDFLNAKPACMDIDRIVIDETECLDSTKSATEPVTKGEKLTVKQDKQSVEMTANIILEDTDEQMDISSDENLHNSELPGGCGRKRTQKEEDSPSASKRSRLDDKLEDQSKEKPRETAAPSEILDSDDDDVILEEEAPVAVNVGEEPIKKKDDNLVLLSSEALQKLISLRVKAFLKSHKKINLDKLNQRTKSMQTASNLWRETAKHLEKSITSLVALNQKLEKHKKQLESRSVGIQVNGERPSSFLPIVNGTYNRMPETAPSSAGQSLSRSVPINPPLQIQQPIRHHQVQSSPSSNPALRSPAFVAQPPAMRMQNRPGRPAVSFALAPNTPHTLPQRHALTLPGRMPQPPPPPVRPPIAQHTNVVQLIDLTDDDDSSRKIVTWAPKFTPPQPGTSNISKLVMGGKSTPGNSHIKPGAIHQGSNGQIMHSSSSGSQALHLASSKPGTGASSNSPYNLVTITNSNLGMAQDSRQGAPPNTPQNSAGRSNLSTNKRALPQNSTQSVPSPAKTSPAHSLPPSFHISNKHPAPLPTGMDAGNAPPSAKRRPPKPGLKISRVSQGIVLSWNMPPLLHVEKITSYQLFAYQESDSMIPKSSLWKKVGDVKALPLPMACTLTQFQEGNKYHFAVRAVDQYGRWGSYSDPSSIYLGSKT